MTGARDDIPFRALVTGATGFLGSRLALRLAQSGWEVHVLVRGASSPLDQRLVGHPAVHVHAGTWTGDELRRVVTRVRPSTCFHLASCFLATHQPGDIQRLVESNVTFGTQLLEAIVEAQVPRFIDTGTAWQHFGVIDDDQRAVNLYAATKQAFQRILAWYCDAHPLRGITIKLPDTYGPDDPRRKLLTLLHEAAITGELLRMSPGEQLIDLVHVDDVIAAFVRGDQIAMAEPSPGWQAWGISSGAPISLRQLATTYERVLNRSIPIDFGALPYRDREVMVPWNPEPVLPGWRPTISLEEGLTSLTGVRT